MTAPGRPAAYPQQAQASPVPVVMTGTARDRGWPELEIYAGTAGEERHDSDLVELTRAIGRRASRCAADLRARPGWSRHHAVRHRRSRGQRT